MELKEAAGFPRVGVVLGSTSDFEALREALAVFDEFGVKYDVAVISAHRTPDLLRRYALEAPGRGVAVILAAAGLSAALPGMLSAYTTLPVIGLPVKTGPLGGVDALLSMVQMPPGVPVAVTGIGSAKNAALCCLRVMALIEPALWKKLEEYREKMTKEGEERLSFPQSVGLPGWKPSFESR
ncbi:MAG: 5-(carboxyamino)imidazole ribonucleotide mutase [Firmicutes bacterium]|nr:5-(carboxyamino)imidazole ribonucleotide mutase [Candidatus Fermentithermobacillaceae bacterium]